MQCKLYPSVPYLDIAPLIRRQIQHVNYKQTEALTRGKLYPGIKVGVRQRGVRAPPMAPVGYAGAGLALHRT